MGTRVRVGKGFTFGASGLRFGHSIPGVPRSYVSVGRSGTLLVGGRLRHWEPASRRPAPASGSPRCQGLLRSGAQCANRASLVPVSDPRPEGRRSPLTCAIHQDQCGAVAATQAAEMARRGLGPVLGPRTLGGHTGGEWIFSLLVAGIVLGLFLWGYSHQAGCIQGATCA